MAVITISRQFGAGGKTLGEKLAKCLGYTFVDDQIIEKVAERAKVSKNWVQSIESEAGGALLKVLSRLVTKSFMDRLLEGTAKGHIDEEIYVSALREVIEQIAKEDHCVILGRGGQFILKNRENVFHLLLVAEKEDRIKFMESHYDLLPTQAKNIVNTQDKRRRNLLHRFDDTIDYDHPSLYTMVLNMSKLSIDRAAEIVCNTVHS